ncbi:hypothetical protein MRX96_014803 [Rhipicephalus microplus]
MRSRDQGYRILMVVSCRRTAILVRRPTASEYDIEDRVLVLNDSNFDVAIKEHKQVFVLFCLTFDKCEALAADCAKAAKQLEEEGSDIKAFVDSANVTVVGFFKDQTSVEAKEFLKAAYTIEQHSFAITSEDAVYKELGASKDGVVLFKKFDEGKNTLTLKPTRDKIRSFVAMNSQPLVVELTRENTQDLLRGPIQQYSLLFFAKDIANLKEVMENFREAAAAFRLQVVFVAIDIDQEEPRDPPHVLPDLEGPCSCPALRQARGCRCYQLQARHEFAQGRGHQELRPRRAGRQHQRRPPVAVYAGTRTLPFAQVVTQKNFDEVVFDKTKDVLVLFYSPWCNLCDRLAQIYDSLAHEYKDHKSLLIAKMDATTNELEHTEVHSFPTLRLYKKQTNEVVEYNGEQTREGLSDFTDATLKVKMTRMREKEVDEAVHADVYDEVDEDRNEDVDELADDGRDNEHKKRDEL